MKSNSIFEKKLHPLMQAGALISAIVVFDLILAAVNHGSEAEDAGLVYWEITGAFLLFYAMMNSVFSLAFEDQNFYWLYSIIGFVIMLLGGAGLAVLFSGIGLNEAWSFRWIFMIFTFGYLVLLTMVRTMKKIITIAQEQDGKLRGE